MLHNTQFIFGYVVWHENVHLPVFIIPLRVICCLRTVIKCSVCFLLMDLTPKTSIVNMKQIDLISVQIHRKYICSMWCLILSNCAR